MSSEPAFGSQYIRDAVGSAASQAWLGGELSSDGRAGSVLMGTGRLEEAQPFSRGALSRGSRLTSRINLIPARRPRRWALRQVTRPGA
jgi:hypothetical protein